MLSSLTRSMARATPRVHLRASSTLADSDPEAYNPIIPSRESIFQKFPLKPKCIQRQVWVEALEGNATSKLVSLHPDIWSVRPRIDAIQKNVEWQLEYKTVSYIKQRDRHEMPPGPPGRPWQQKGTGRARHATIRSPLWINGGKVNGPCGLQAKYWMLEPHVRVNGLIHTLAVKFAQDDVRVVKDLEVPTDGPEYLEQLVDDRNWGISVLFVSASDLFPTNITTAVSSIQHMNLMPLYGLNVHSMLKHKTLVLTEDALSLLEYRLLYALYRPDFKTVRENGFKYLDRLQLH